MTNDHHQLLTFKLDERQYAIPVALVERVLAAVETTAVPNSPAGLQGLINVEGELIPVVDLRQMMRHASKSLTVHNQFLLVKLQARSWAIIVDDVGEVIHSTDSDVVSMKQFIHEEVDYIDGIIKQDATVIFLLNLKKLLSHQDFHAVESLVSNGNKII